MGLWASVCKKNFMKSLFPAREIVDLKNVNICAVNKKTWTSMSWTKIPEQKYVNIYVMNKKNLNRKTWTTIRECNDVNGGDAALLPNIYKFENKLMFKFRPHQLRLNQEVERF